MGTRAFPAALCAAAAGIAVLGATLPQDAARYTRTTPLDTGDTVRIDTGLIRIDLDGALALKIPDAAELKPTGFKTPDGRDGWAIRIPGGRPIATPAYADGMIFVGGGYGSYEFYALDAQTGAVVWKIHTNDDGPTAAVVEDGYVAFNTESCTVMVVEAQTGKMVWQEWLGDPLMSQPAISNGRLFIAHPAGGRGGHIQEQSNHVFPTQPHLPPAQHNVSPAQHIDPPAVVDAPEGGSHRMLCTDLRTGAHLWSRAITSDVISAPVVEGDTLMFTCFDGSSYCLRASTGELVWRKESGGTSAPVIVDGHAVMTMKEERDGDSYEGIKRFDLRLGNDRDSSMMAAGVARYLAPNKGGGVGVSADSLATLDQSVGFGSAPATANLDEANRNVGVSTVAGGWAYQGSRAVVSRGQVMNAQGRYLNNVTLVDGRRAWRAEARGKGVADGSQVFSPPALGRDNLYLSTAQGHLLALRQSDGAMDFLYRTDHPAAFQPALALGNVYVGTNDGWVICLKTGKADADGWYAWGGNAQHNKKGS